MTTFKYNKLSRSLTGSDLQNNKFILVYVGEYENQGNSCVLSSIQTQYIGTYILHILAFFMLADYFKYYFEDWCMKNIFNKQAHSYCRLYDFFWKPCVPWTNSKIGSSSYVHPFNAFWVDKALKNNNISLRRDFT